MKCLFLFLILAFAYSNTSADSLTGERTKIARLFTIGTLPLGLVDVQNTMWLSLQRSMTPKVAVQLDVGYIFYNALTNNDEITISKNKPSFNIKAELKFFRHSVFLGGYLSSQIMYRQTYYGATEWGLYSSPGSSVEFITHAFDIARTTWALSLKYGYRSQVSKRISIDYYVGIGIRYIQNRDVNKLIEREKDGNDSYELALCRKKSAKVSANLQGDYLRPNFILGFRINVYWIR